MRDVTVASVQFEHSPGECHAQMPARGFRSQRQHPDATAGRGSLAAGEPVRDKQADAARQQNIAARDH